LVDGDDMNEPIADAVRSILDGHVVLSRDLAHANHYPAVDVLASVSRLTTEIQPPESIAAAAELRRLMAAYRDKEDLIAIGAYQPGGDPTVDTAIALRPELDAFLRQRPDERSDLTEADARLGELAAAATGSSAPDDLPPEPSGPAEVPSPGPGRVED
jgi:flagellum-specific ATP synthase